MTTWWDDVEYLATQAQRIEDMDVDNEEYECKCRRCGADLSEWNEEKSDE